MALPEYTIRQLLEAGVHFGHRKHLWNPKMSRYIYGTRKNIHIIDLSQTAPMLYEALQAISSTVSKGGRVLMVGTKRQAQDCIADAAKQSAQYFVNARWLGGMLTNWKTVSQAIQRLCDLDEVLDGDTTGRTKKEILNLTREREKLDRNLGGIRDMGGVPDMLFVIDSNRESIAIEEAKRLDIPVAAVLDSNSNPDGIAYPIPGNDDAARSITLYCDLVAKAAIDGLSRAENRPEVGAGTDDASDVSSKAADEKSRSSRRKIKARKTGSDKDEKIEKSSESDSESTADPKDEGKEAKAAKTKRKSDSKTAKKPATARAKKSAGSDKKSEVKAKDAKKSETGATGKTAGADTAKNEAAKKPADAEKDSSTAKAKESESESSKSAEKSE